MRRSRPALNTLLSLASLASLATTPNLACSSRRDTPPTDDENALLAQDGSDANAAEGNAAGMTSTFVTAQSGGIGFSSAVDLVGGTLSTQGIGDTIKGVYSGCKTPLAPIQDAAAQTVTYTFDGCTGPYGLVNVTGVVVAKYDVVSPTQIKLDLSSKGLKVNKTTIDWTAKADITSVGSARTMVWDGTLGGTTGRGRTFARVDRKTITWEAGGQCITVNGSSEGDVTGRKVRTDVTTMSLCKGACPGPGGSVKVTSAESGKSISIDYDGDETATYTGPNGGKAEVRLACGL